MRTRYVICFLDFLIFRYTWDIVPNFCRFYSTLARGIRSTTGKGLWPYCQRWWSYLSSSCNLTIFFFFSFFQRGCCEIQQEVLYINNLLLVSFSICQGDKLLWYFLGSFSFESSDKCCHFELTELTENDCIHATECNFILVLPNPGPTYKV